MSLINPRTLQPCPYIKSDRGYIALDTSQISKAIQWFSEAAIAAVNPVATCAEPPPVTCTAITIWRPTVEVPITELGYYREGSKQKALPGVDLLHSNVRIVLTMPVAA